ncbi:MAG: hypothetical protein AABW47_03525 [Nanoarchaeota archaeon]
MIANQFDNLGKTNSAGASLGFYTPAHKPRREVVYEILPLWGEFTIKNRAHADKNENFESESTKIRVPEAHLPRNCIEHKASVYKPCFELPVHCSDSPEIERISWRGNDIYFGIVNNKLAIYSAYSNNVGKGMRLYGIEKLTIEQSKDRQYLKTRAIIALNNLIKQDMQKQGMSKEALEVNRVAWNNFHPADLKAHDEGKDYGIYTSREIKWKEQSASDVSELDVAA